MRILGTRQRAQQKGRYPRGLRTRSHRGREAKATPSGRSTQPSGRAGFLLLGLVLGAGGGLAYVARRLMVITPLPVWGELSCQRLLAGASERSPWGTPAIYFLVPGVGPLIGPSWGGRPWDPWPLCPGSSPPTDRCLDTSSRLTQSPILLVPAGVSTNKLPATGERPIRRWPYLVCSRSGPYPHLRRESRRVSTQVGGA